MKNPQPISNDRWQRAYEPAPDAFVRSMAQALSQTNEEVPMKRWTMRTAAIAVAILVALTGVALAVANGTGVLGFLFPGQSPEGLPVQTAVPQTGGDAMETITVKVRDAVSDGLAIHMAVECAAKDPNDAILYDLDSLYLYPYEGQEAPTLPIEEEGKGFMHPFVSKAKQAKRVLIVGTPMAKLGEFDLVAGTNWYYESPSVLVVDYIIDLRPGAFDGYDPGTIPTLPLPDPLTVTLTPSVWLQKVGDPECEDLEQGKIQVTVAQQNAQAKDKIKTYVATNLPIDGPDSRLDEARFVSTPLGIYASFVFTDNTGSPEWESTSSLIVGSYWVDALGADGQPIQKLNGGYKKYADPEQSGTTQRIEVFLAAQDLPEKLTLRPYDSGDASKTFPDITLTLRQE